MYNTFLQECRGDSSQWTAWRYRTELDCLERADLAPSLPRCQASPGHWTAQKTNWTKAL